MAKNKPNPPAPRRCSRGEIIRLAWIMAAPDVKNSKFNAWVRHWRECPACRATGKV